MSAHDEREAFEAWALSENMRLLRVDGDQYEYESGARYAWAGWQAALATPSAAPAPDADAGRVNAQSLLDYFAAKAMQGVLAGDHPVTHGNNPLPEVARIAYEMADAMLKVRQA